LGKSRLLREASAGEVRDDDLDTLKGSGEGGIRIVVDRLDLGAEGDELLGGGVVGLVSSERCGDEWKARRSTGTQTYRLSPREDNNSDGPLLVHFEKSAGDVVAETSGDLGGAASGPGDGEGGVGLGGGRHDGVRARARWMDVVGGTSVGCQISPFSVPSRDCVRWC
jgi:hypothetical protein